MRTWGQSKMSSSCISLWFESGELRRRRSSRFPCVTTVVETFSSDRVTFRNPSNINNGALLKKQPMTLRRRLFPQKSSTEDFRPDSKCGSDWRCCECVVRVDCKCISAFMHVCMYVCMYVCMHVCMYVYIYICIYICIYIRIYIKFTTQIFSSADESLKEKRICYCSELVR